MVYNKNKDEDEHYDIKEHYDENSLKASDFPWYSYAGMIVALFLLVAFGWWARDRIKEYFYPTDKTKTEVQDISKQVISADLVYSKDGDTVHPPIGVARNATQTGKK